MSAVRRTKSLLKSTHAAKPARVMRDTETSTTRRAKAARVTHSSRPRGVAPSPWMNHPAHDPEAALPDLSPDPSGAGAGGARAIEPLAYETPREGYLAESSTSAGTTEGEASAERGHAPVRGEDSDVFACDPVRGVTSLGARAESVGGAPAESAATSAVTLFVYGWENVEPGTLSWVFPNLRAALSAVRTMRNAVAWCICAGEKSEMTAARERGVLIEQLPRS